MTEEIWIPVVGYEGLYEVSSYGRVRSLDRYDSRNHFRKGKLMNFIYEGEYLKVDFSKNGINKRYVVHRLVAKAFIPNPDNLPQINHKDEDKTNNRVDNLEWCDAKYNINYGTRQERFRNTMLEKGHWTGLSKKEYKRKYREEHRDYINEYRREYRRKKKAGL